MKTKLLLIVIINFLFVINTIGQNQEYKIIRSNPINTASEPIAILGELDEKIMVLNNNKLQKFNKNLVLEEEITLNFDVEEGKTLTLYEITILGNNIVYFGWQKNNQGQKELYYTIIESANIYKKNKVFKIGAIEYDIKSPNTSFRIFQSKNNLFISVLFLNKVSISEKSNINCKTFDDEMNKIWEKELDIDMKFNKYELSSMYLDNNANLYLYGSFWNFSTENGENKIIDKKNLVFHYNDISGESTTYEIEKYFNFMNFIVDSNYIKLIGLSTSIGENPNGVFYISINTDSKTIEETKTEVFSETYFVQFEESNKKYIKNLRKGEYFVENFLPVTYIPGNDGSLTMIFQTYETDVCKRMNKKEINCISNYTFGTNLIIKIDKDGEIEYTNRIVRNTYMLIRKYQSINFLDSDNNLIMIYNDNLKNDKIADPSDYIFYANQKKTSVVLYKISSDQKLKRVKIYDTTEGEFPVYNSAYQSDNSLYFISLSGQKMKLNKIDF